MTELTNERAKLDHPNLLKFMGYSAKTHEEMCGS
jgi:hypothetical protein